MIISTQKLKSLYEDLLTRVEMLECQILKMGGSIPEDTPEENGDPLPKTENPVSKPQSLAKKSGPGPGQRNEFSSSRWKKNQ